MTIYKPVGGGIRRCRKIWRSALRGLSKKVAKVLHDGARLPLRRSPFQWRAPRQRAFSDSEKAVIRTEIKEALYHGALHRVQPVQGQVLSPITLNSKGDRLCINFIVNKFIKPKPFRETTLKDFKLDMKQGDWAVKADLKKAFWTVPVFNKHRRFLRFRWEGVVYEFKTLPFGLASSPWSLRLVTKPIIKHLRSMGIRAHCFVDDLIILNKSKQGAEDDLRAAVELFERLGFTVNKEKTSVAASKVFTFLGLSYNSEDMTHSAPPDKLRDVRKMARRLLAQADTTGVWTPRQMASLVGKVQFIKPTLLKGKPQVAALLDWNKQALALARRALGRKPTRRHWDWATEADGQALPAVKWMAKLSSKETGAPLHPRDPEETWLTDAGPLGYGWVRTDHRQQMAQERAGKWTAWEAMQSTNYRELKVLLMLIKETPKCSRWRSIRWMTDSRVAMHVQRKARGRTDALSKLARSVAQMAEDKHLILDGQHVTQEEVARADVLSRIADKTDDHLHASAFERARRRLGARPDLDTMATRFTAQLPQFWALRDSQAQAHDAMKQDWGGARLYIFPPIKMIKQVLDKIDADKPQEVMMVVPDWPAATWHHALRASARDRTVIARGAVSSLSPKRSSFRYAAYLIKPSPRRK